MELTIKSVILAVTLILGQITKKMGWIDKRYIPWQNLLIGLISGVICWLCNLENNLATSLMKCVITSYGAGGLYDNINIKNPIEEIEIDEDEGGEA